MRFRSARKCKSFFLAIFAAVIMVLPVYADEPMVAVVPDKNTKKQIQNRNAQNESSTQPVKRSYTAGKNKVYPLGQSHANTP